MSNSDEEFAPEQFGSTGRETQLLVGILVLGVLAVVAVVVLDVPGWLRGDTDLLGNYRYAQRIEQRHRQFTLMERVHAELFPRWLVYRARPPKRLPDGQPEATYAELREAIDDKKLRQVLEDLRRITGSGDPARHTSEIVDAMDRWNRRMEELGEPFFIRLNVTRRGGRSFVYGAFYRRMAQPTVRVGSSQHDALLLRRIDDTNLFEGFLGMSRADAPLVFVVTDRVLDFALEDVLPVVAAGADAESGTSDESSLDRVSSQFAARIRKELRKGIGEERYGDLERAARARVRLTRQVDAIRQRRACSNFILADPPWNGYNARTRDRLDVFAERDELKECPSVKFEEAEVIREASGSLKTETAEAAIEATLAYLSRVITIHEARHHADQKADEDGDSAPTCKSCPEAMSAGTRAELSAYTASIAWSEMPALALFQACKANPSGAHRRALGYYLDQFGTLCDQPLPSDLQSRSRELEESLFGRSDEISLPDDFPEKLDIRIW